MKIKIDSGGYLMLCRDNRDTFKKQFCVYNYNRRCGDDCPAFHYKYSDSHHRAEFDGCCFSFTIPANNFIDERA